MADQRLLVGDGERGGEARGCKIVCVCGCQDAGESVEEEKRRELLNEVVYCCNV